MEQVFDNTSNYMIMYQNNTRDNNYRKTTNSNKIKNT